jgi:hypothetical protein
MISLDAKSRGKTSPMTLRKTNSTTYNIMFTTKIINLDVCRDEDKEREK